MTITTKPYYFELPAAGSTRSRGKTLSMTDDYRSRQGLEPAAVFSSTSELVVALAEHRREHGFYAGSEYRQTAIAEAMSVEPSAVSRLEREAAGEPPREPTLAKLQAYARAMGYDAWLVCVERDLLPFRPYSADS